MVRRLSRHKFLPEEARSKRTLSVVNCFSSQPWNTLVTQGLHSRGRFHIRPSRVLFRYLERVPIDQGHSSCSNL